MPAKPRFHRRTAATKGFTPEQIAALKAANDGGKSGTPEKVLEAFFPDRINVAGLPLRPMSLSDFMFLEDIGSPLIKDESDAAARAAVTARDYLRAIFLLATPPQQVREIYAAGLPKFDATIAEFGDRIPVAEIITVGQKVQAVIRAGFATVMPMTAEKKTGQTPASAGG